jgi:hypothetical protein
VPAVNTTQPPSSGDARRPGVRIRATRDPEEIKRWAQVHGAEPATGEASPSGPAVPLAANDGGVGIRFNFPGFARFRPISWDEWLEHLDRYRLSFVYEEEDDTQIAAKAYDIAEARGHGHDRDDWFEAERDLRRRGGGGTPSMRYRFMQDT